MFLPEALGRRECAAFLFVKENFKPKVFRL
jgi:hypothetical protein